MKLLTTEITDYQNYGKLERLLKILTDNGFTIYANYNPVKIHAEPTVRWSVVDANIYAYK